MTRGVCESALGPHSPRHSRRCNVLRSEESALSDPSRRKYARRLYPLALIVCFAIACIPSYRESLAIKGYDPVIFFAAEKLMAGLSVVTGGAPANRSASDRDFPGSGVTPPRAHPRVGQAGTLRASLAPCSDGCCSDPPRQGSRLDASRLVLQER